MGSNAHSQFADDTNLSGTVKLLEVPCHSEVPGRAWYLDGLENHHDFMKT